MFKPYSVRKGIVTFDEQTLIMNEETKAATKAALEELSLNYETYKEIGKNLLKYYPVPLSMEIIKNFFLAFRKLNSADEINTFLEIILMSYASLYDKSWEYQNISSVIDSINDVFAYRKYMYIIEKTDLHIYPYSDEVTSDEIKEILSVGDEISLNISEAIKNYLKKPGNAVHEAAKALEHFLINEMNCNGKTLNPLLKDLKTKQKYLYLSPEYQEILDKILARVMKLRNDGKNSAHPGNTVISVMEARMTILTIVNFINAFRMV